MVETSPTPQVQAQATTKSDQSFESEIKIQTIKKDGKVFEVDIEKRANGLGVSLAGGKNSDICYKGK